MQGDAAAADCELSEAFKAEDRERVFEAKAFGGGEAKCFTS